jgi:hypothetical protein
MNRTALTIVFMMLAGVICTGCKGPVFNLPHPDRLAHPGPGVSGPGPGVLTPEEMMAGPSAAQLAQLAAFERQLAERQTGRAGPLKCLLCGARNRRLCACNRGANAQDASAGCGIDSGVVGRIPSVQVLFTKPGGMHVTWDESGTGTFFDTPLVSPARTNFDTAGLYRLKLTHIPAHEGLELYPTVEIAPPTPRTHAFLAHNTVPVQWTVDDLNQISAGNFVTKVIYLPDPDYQHLAVAGVETLVSTRLDPGIDPIVEADRRGSILAIVRTGNKDIEMPGMDGEATIGYSTFTGAPGSPIAQVSGMGGVGFGPGIGANGFVTGVNSPSYGYPITGTPIGLPGPPHIPLGAPAGLRKHEMRNWSRNYMPDPSHKVRINVKQNPTIRYPAPKTHAWIQQYNHPNCAHCIGSN